MWTQQGSKLVGTGAVGSAYQGGSVAISADGNTAIVGGRTDNSQAGAAWVFTRTNGVWTQQGDKLVGTGADGNAAQGYSVALSADGNTAIVGGIGDNSGVGAVWVFTRTGSVWAQQGSKLVGTGTAVGGSAQQGSAVALSTDGNTALVGGYADSTTGAAWVFTRSGGMWTQQGSKLVGTGALGSAVWQGYAVSLSADGNTATVGGPNDNSNVGAAWVFTRSAGVWTQQGSKLVGTGAVDASLQGNSVAVSADGNTALVGGPGDNHSSLTGAAWVFTRSGGMWTQQGSKLVGTGAIGAIEGFSVSLSGDGNTALVGGPSDNSGTGAVWVFVQPITSLQVTPTTNMVAAGNQGGPFTPSSFQYQLSATAGSFNYSISGYPNWLTPSPISGIASTTPTNVTFTVNSNANSRAASDNATITFTNMVTGQGTQIRTATLTVNPPALQVSPSTNIVASGTHGGPFSPSSFNYALSATYGTVNYSITNVPSWLSVSPSSGTLTTSATTVTFKVNSSADKLAPNTYVSNVNFINTTGGQGNTARVATLTVYPKQYNLTLAASPTADGTVSGGGTVAEGSSTTVIATPIGNHTFVDWTENGKVVSTSASYTFTIPSANVKLTAQFK
jgi:hypothetical protein